MRQKFRVIARQEPGMRGQTAYRYYPLPGYKNPSQEEID